MCVRFPPKFDVQTSYNICCEQRISSGNLSNDSARYVGLYSAQSKISLKLTQTVFEKKLITLMPPVYKSFREKMTSISTPPPINQMMTSSPTLVSASSFTFTFIRRLRLLAYTQLLLFVGFFLWIQVCSLD